MIPKSMRAVVAPNPGGPEALTLVERPVPTPGTGEILIQVAAAGVNRPDMLQRQGAYAPPPGASDILDWRSPARSSRSAKTRKCIMSATA